MKKILIISALCICSILSANAQVSRLKIGFIPYTDPEFASAEQREQAYKNLYEMALRIFINTQRFIVLDRGSFNVVKLEKEFQRSDDLINSEIIKQGKILAAQVVIVAKISTFNVTEADDGEGFSTFIAAELKQVDVETGKAVRAIQLKSEVVDGKADPLGIGMKKKRIKSWEEAINLAVNKMEKDLDTWIKEQFSLMMGVMDKEDVSMGLIVDGGKQTGLTKSYKLRVVKLKVLDDGKRYMETLAKLSYSEEGIGEETTKLLITDKTDWYKFLAAWQEDKTKILVVEDNR